MKPVHEFSLSSPHTYKICRPTVPVLFCTHTFFVFLLSLFAYAPCVCTLPTNIYFSLCKANRPTSIIYTKKKEFAWKYNTSFIARWWLAFACAAAGQKAILYFLSFRCVVCANDPSIPILLMMHSHHFEGMWDMWPADGCMMVHIEIQKKSFRFGISRSWEEIFTIRRPISNSNRCGRFFGAWGLTELFRWRYINCCWWTKTKDFVHEKTRNLLYYTSSNSTSKAILICLRFIRIVERWLSWSKWTLSFYMNSGGLRINRVFRYCSKYML